jgi:hypothetical protein
MKSAAPRWAACAIANVGVIASETTAAARTSLADRITRLTSFQGR